MRYASWNGVVSLVWIQQRFQQHLQKFSVEPRYSPLSGCRPQQLEAWKCHCQSRVERDRAQRKKRESWTLLHFLSVQWKEEAPTGPTVLVHVSPCLCDHPPKVLSTQPQAAVDIFEVQSISYCISTYRLMWRANIIVIIVNSGRYSILNTVHLRACHFELPHFLHTLLEPKAILADAFELQKIALPCPSRSAPDSIWPYGSAPSCRTPHRYPPGTSPLIDGSDL